MNTLKLYGIICRDYKMGDIAEHTMVNLTELKRHYARFWTKDIKWRDTCLREIQATFPKETYIPIEINNPFIPTPSNERKDNGKAKSTSRNRSNTSTKGRNLR